MSDWYGVRDAACPLSTRGGGGRRRTHNDVSEWAPYMCHLPRRGSSSLFWDRTRLQRGASEALHKHTHHHRVRARSPYARERAAECSWGFWCWKSVLQHRAEVCAAGSYPLPLPRRIASLRAREGTLQTPAPAARRPPRGRCAAVPALQLPSIRTASPNGWVSAWLHLAR